MAKAARQLISDHLRGASAQSILEEFLAFDGVDWEGLRKNLLCDLGKIPVKPERLEVGPETKILFSESVLEEHKHAILVIVETYARVYHDVDFVLGQGEPSDE
jgi:hypothetical protein